MLAAKTNEERIALAFRRVLVRAPTAGELSVLRDGLGRWQREFARDPAAAERFLTVGEWRGQKTLPAVELAAYTGLCETILNLDEALTKE